MGYWSLPPHLRVIQAVDIDLQLAPADEPGISRRPDLIIVDLDPPVTLLSCHLADEFGYQDAGAVTGEFITSEPYKLKISLDQLS